MCEQSGMWKGFEGIVRAVLGQRHFIIVREDKELLVVDHGVDAIVLVSPSAREERSGEARDSPDIGQLHLNSTPGALVVAAGKVGGDDICLFADGRHGHALLAGDDDRLVGVVVRDRVEVRYVGDGELRAATVHDEVFNAGSISEKCSVRGEPAASGAPVGRAGCSCCQGYRTRFGEQAGRAARFLVGVEAKRRR